MLRKRLRTRALQGLTLTTAIVVAMAVVAPVSARADSSPDSDVFSLTVTPSSGLSRAGQSVTAAGAITPQPGHTGFHVRVAECGATCTTLATAALSATGTYSTPVNVTLCEPGCTIKATVIEDVDDTASTPIAFAPRSATTTALQLSAAGFGSGASLTVPFGTSVHAQATVTPTGTFALNGVLAYQLFTDASCSVSSGAGTSSTLPANPGADAPSASNLVPTPGTYYWLASYQGDPNNQPSSSACNSNVLTVTAPLVTSVTATPEPVTAGQLVQYSLTVQNVGPTAATGVQLVDTLPSGSTLFSASAGCAGTAPVTCAVGSLAPSATATATLLVTTPSTPGIITDSATATPGTNNVASVNSTVTTQTPGSVSGFVPPGGSLDTGGDNPAHLSLPNTGSGASVSITQAFESFCNGPCTGIASDISPFVGYTDPRHPITLRLTYSYTSLVSATVDFLSATIWKLADTAPTGTIVGDCKDDPNWTPAQHAAAALRRLARIGTHSGIANPSPCVDARTINRVGTNKYTVSFTVLYLSGDPHVARK